MSGIYQVHSGTPFTYYDFSNNETGYNVARYTPDGPIPQRTFKSIPSGTSGGGANLYQIGTLPGANSWANPAFIGVDSNLPNGISDWGPWPRSMTGRNSFRGPGFWNVDLAVSKKFPIREHLNLEFRAEGFDILNHHNLFLQEATNDVSSNNVGVDSQGNLIPAINASKGGIGNSGGANDERRFGQFALKVNF